MSLNFLSQTLKNKVRWGILFFFALFFLGCSNKGKHSELMDYIDNIKSRPPQQIEPLPKAKTFEPFSYQAQNQRSPFQPSQRRATGIYQPDVNRPKEPLENFPLDALKMVGTLEQANRNWGLILAPDGNVYQVQVGSYLGKNYGRVDKITDTQIDLTETYINSSNEWSKRPATIAMNTDK